MTTPRERIYGLLQECLKGRDLLGARDAHYLMVANRLDSQTVLCDHLIRLFALCGSLFEASLAFSNAAEPTSHTWQAIISAHVVASENSKAIQLYRKMQECKIEPSKFILSCVLKACSAMGEVDDGRQIHGHIMKNGLETDVVMGSALIDMYAKSGRVMEARKLFDELPSRNVVSWGAIMTCYVQHDAGTTALQLFEKMQAEHIEPDQVTLLCLLKACGSIRALKQGRTAHELVLRGGYEEDMCIGATLVDMYARCGSLEEACKIFYKLVIRNIVAYGALIAGYAQFGNGMLALDLYHQMQLDGIEPNSVIFVSVLKSCGISKAIIAGMLVHQQIMDRCLEMEVPIGSALIDMYSKSGSHEEACKVLDDLPDRDVVSWGAVMSGYAQDGQGLSALGLFVKMQKEGIKPDKVSVLCALNACANIGAVDEGRLIHKVLIQNGLVTDLVLGNALVDMYAKCGCLEDSMRAMQSLENHDVVTWNAMIAGCAQDGQCVRADEFFQNMQEQGHEPDDKTYTSILAGCSHAGVLEQGHKYFDSVKEKLGTMSGVEVYSCMVDLLGRCGCLNEAMDLLHAVPILPDIVIWKSLLTSCRTYSNKKLGNWVFDQILHSDLNDAFGYVLMSNMYADAGKWEIVEQMQDLRYMAHAEKKPGVACIEALDTVHEFTAGNFDHPLMKSINRKLQRLHKLIKCYSHLPNVDLVMQLT